MLDEIFRNFIALNFIIFSVVGAFGGIVISQFRQKYTSSLDYIDSFVILFESGKGLTEQGRKLQRILRWVFLVSGFLFGSCFAILALVVSK